MGFLNNYVSLQGKLEVQRFSTNFNGFLKAKIVVNEVYVDNSGNDVEYTVPIDIVVWGKNAVELSKMGGKEIIVEGNIESKVFDKRCYKCGYDNSILDTHVRVSNFVLVDQFNEYQ